MGCIQHFLSGPAACPQHENFERAEEFRQAVERHLESSGVSFSVADVVQLLGALAVDELAKGTGFEDTLYQRIRTGRVDPTKDECIQDHNMCQNLPEHSHRTISDGTRGPGVNILINDVWRTEIQGKMIDTNTLSKRDAVALLGAHTVGHHHTFGAWVKGPMRFDNDYFIQLKKIIDFAPVVELGEGVGHEYSNRVFPTWFQESSANQITQAGERAAFKGSRFQGQIMMLDSDMSLVLNAPELVVEYADDLGRWRQDFDNAFVKMGELGFTLNRRRLFDFKSEKQLDEDAEFYQNMELLREQQIAKNHHKL